jgi:hypothetical protein
MIRAPARQNAMAKTRSETDSFGSIEVPADRTIAIVSINRDADVMMALYSGEHCAVGMRLWPCLTHINGVA